ncbi:MAG: damage-inducible protein DinB [Bacteroidetes bacterium]|nr:damage-inducible protein DinB [Bacteroidota bacterium]
MRDFLEDLLEYTFQMNERVIAQLNARTWPEPEALYRLMNHTLAAHHIWNQRTLGQPPALAVWADIPREDLLFLNEQNTHQSRSLLSELPLDHSIDYSNSKGDAFTNSFQEILYHIVNHANYHRAQIATEVRRQGGTPLTTDYIFYKRE